MDAPEPLPVGRRAAVEAVPLTSGSGDHAVLLRQGTESRALLTAEPGEGARERVVVIPLDSDLELRVDGDALAIWVASSPPSRRRGGPPAWANAAGFALVILLLGLVVVGGATAFGWVLDLVGTP